MMMTQSSSDGEALNAIRMANAMLKSENMNWGSFLATSLKIEVARRPPMKPAGRGTSEAAARYTKPLSRFTDKEIPMMIASLLRDTKGGFRDFIKSIQGHWDNKGYLTEAQYEAVINAYERAK